MQSQGNTDRIRKRALGVLLLALGVATIAVVVLLNTGCPTDRCFRYKMTVEVETPEGVKTGYAVREMRYHGGGGFMFGEGRPQLTLKGEAVVVDLGGGRFLFALLTGRRGFYDYASNGVSTIFRVMDRDVGPKGGPHELWPNVPTIREPITDPMPMLVTFRDLRDPKSVELVNPANLAATFGKGIKLRRVIIQQTDDPVSIGIGEKLGWFELYKNRQLDGKRYRDFSNFSNTLNLLSLRQGIEE